MNHKRRIASGKGLNAVGVIVYIYQLYTVILDKRYKHALTSMPFKSRRMKGEPK